MKIIKFSIICLLLATASNVFAGNNAVETESVENTLSIEIQNGYPSTQEKDTIELDASQKVFVSILSTSPFITFPDGQMPREIEVPLGEFRTVSFPFIVNEQCKESGQANVELDILMENGYSFSSNVEFPVDPVMPVSGVFSFKVSPNPSNGRVTFNCMNLKSAKPGQLAIYNVLGQTVANIDMPAGTSSISWQGEDRNGRSIASGIYFYYLLDGDGRKIASGKLMIVR